MNTLPILLYIAYIKLKRMIPKVGVAEQFTSLHSGFSTWRGVSTIAEITLWYQHICKVAHDQWTFSLFEIQQKFLHGIALSILSNCFCSTLDILAYLFQALPVYFYFCSLYCVCMFYYLLLKKNNALQLVVVKGIKKAYQNLKLSRINKIMWKYIYSKI